MSALTSPVFGPRLREGRQSRESREGREGFVQAAQRHRAQLRIVPELAAQLSQRVFWGMLIALVIGGTALLLMLNVTLQNQAFDLRTLAAEEQVLQNQEAAMRQQLTERSSSAELAQRAIDRGMVPATAPGFLMLPDGTMVGDPEAATGAGPYAGLRTPVTPAAAPAAVAVAPVATPAAPVATPATAAVPPSVPPSAGAAVAGPQVAAPSTVRTPGAAPPAQTAGQQATTGAMSTNASSQEG